MNNITEKDITIIGAGITGLTTAYYLQKKGYTIQLIDKLPQVGGQMQTLQKDGYTFETGPNTGVLSSPEIVELLQDLSAHCEVEKAHRSAHKRLIWKGTRFYALPSGLWSAITTPLFTWKDKFGILLEPWRKKGTDPLESVGSLAKRRLGKSFLEYAVDPFLSGIYAGNHEKLITQFALPKLYRLEQDYGSFIRGAIAKAKQPKTDRDKSATKEVFSLKGGFSALTHAIAKIIGEENISLQAAYTHISPQGNKWHTIFVQDGEERHIESKHVISTAGAYALPELFPFLPTDTLQHLNNLYYAPVVQVAVALPQREDSWLHAFGGLIPGIEKKEVLGILFPSACFDHKAPKGQALFSFFMGGTRHPELYEASDERIHAIVERSVIDLLKYPKETPIKILGIFRHQRAIPQYEANSAIRFQAVQEVEAQYQGLHIGGNLIGGISISDRVKQGVSLASRI